MDPTLSEAFQDFRRYCKAEGENQISSFVNDYYIAYPAIEYRPAILYEVAHLAFRNALEELGEKIGQRRTTFAWTRLIYKKMEPTTASLNVSLDSFTVVLFTDETQPSDFVADGPTDVGMELSIFGNGNEIEDALNW